MMGRCGKLGFRGTHNPQIVGSIPSSGITECPDGYYVFTPGTTNLKVPQASAAVDHILTRTLLNTGGTITSTPTMEVTGVASAPGGVLHPRIRTTIAPLGWGTSEVGPINSEAYSWGDYLAIRQKMRAHPEVQWIVLHGTDNFAFCSTVVALCVRELGCKAVTLACQKSIDRPTWEGGRLMVAAHHLLDRMKRGTCYALSYVDAHHLALHHPLEVRKMHTSRKNCIHSEHQRVFSDPHPPALPPCHIPQGDWRWTTPSRAAIEYITPMTLTPAAPYVVSYGLGNLPSHIPRAQDVGSRIPHGPYSPTVYGRTPTLCRHPSHSVEADYLIRCLT